MNKAFENKWGKSPWRWRVPRRKSSRIPKSADFVVIGGGFSGLSAACWLGRLAPGKKIVLLEADRIGAGASGRTGGMALAETAGGDLPGLGDVLGGFAEIVQELEIECDFLRNGAWELGRKDESEDGGKSGRKDDSGDQGKDGGASSELSWTDAGRLRVVREVPGGTVDAGKLLSGLARAAIAAKVTILEGRAVTAVKPGEKIRVVADGKEILAGSALVATNAQSLELAGLQEKATPKLTMGVATAPLDASTVEAIGLESRRPFYTVDLPYLWGRLKNDNSAIFGAGLVTVKDWEELHTIDVRRGRAAELLESLKERVRGLHPALRGVKFTHAWGGPILLTDGARPIFARVGPQTGGRPLTKARRGQDVIYLGGYNGHGVALSVYLGRWAAEAMLGKRKLPQWGC